MPRDILTDLNQRNMTMTREILESAVEREARLGGQGDWERAIAQLVLLDRLARAGQQHKDPCEQQAGGKRDQ